MAQRWRECQGAVKSGADAMTGRGRRGRLMWGLRACRASGLLEQIIPADPLRGPLNSVVRLSLRMRSLMGHALAIATL